MIDPIPLDELPARMLATQSAPLAMHLATALEQMRGGRA